MWWSEPWSSYSPTEDPKESRSVISCTPQESKEENTSFSLDCPQEHLEILEDESILSGKWHVSLKAWGKCHSCCLWMAEPPAGVCAFPSACLEHNIQQHIQHYRVFFLVQTETSSLDLVFNRPNLTRLFLCMWHLPKATALQKWNNSTNVPQTCFFLMFIS